MKLLSLHIEHFGRLADFSYVFEDPLNTILAENGWGKSTLAVFLKVMFYGFDGEMKRNEEGNERLRYRPWGGGIYGGSVTFQKGDKAYRMLRIFGARKKEDTFHLYDEETGLPSSDFSEQIGEELFGIDRESFSRTVFWSQQDHETEATTMIQAKIGDVASEQDDLTSYDRAVRQLKKEIDRLSPDRASGQIRKKQDRAAVLEAEAARLPGLKQELQQSERHQKDLSDSLEEIRERRQAYTVASTAAIPAQMQAEADPALAALQAKLSASGERLEMLQRIRRSTAAQGHKEREEYLRVQRQCNRLEQDAAFSANRAAGRYRTAGLLSLAVTILFLILIALHAISLPFLAMPVLSAVCSIYCLFRSRRNDADPALVSRLEELRQEERDLHASLRSLSGRLGRAKQQILEEEKRRKDLQAEIRSRTPAARAAAIRTPSTEEIADRIAPGLTEFDRREEECRKELADARQQSEDLRQRIAESEDAAERLIKLRREIDTLRDRYEICVKTVGCLEQARGSFTARYMNPFLRSFRRHYGMLTGESAENLQTDADFHITVMSDGLPRDPSLMSEGTRDLISLCRRMAMVDAMYPGEKPFLVLDDPFSNLDDERVKGGLRFLRSASYEYQILYLTCHNHLSREDPSSQLFHRNRLHADLFRVVELLSAGFVEILRQIDLDLLVAPCDRRVQPYQAADLPALVSGLLFQFS